ncbi:CMP-N-acetylneuraminate-beta-galactosamide-alpha-2,3-sialyltransferase 1-like [Cheilinus undulatus]|uniref:CMP-N-acetylneuraminate-beta-galactosamide- alpha-2,3-sialyltransferase 1-like n=1 Tax=Cheilinus undulatus TaxID=241271 RepID=UPI001BD229A5|nr:CMP-N-acetylneuraminate-beta-galactosamide-alpha-2,3-sialyltransferase 1-like [Cheilinus undulatus]
MWWKRVQGTKANFSVFTQRVGELFKVIPRHPNVTKACPEGCTTCAVVGNSVTLKGSRYGPLINFHDVVAPVRGWEADVGNKTTHRIMYPESSTHLDNNTRLVMFPFKLQDLEWLPKALTTGAQRFRSKIRANKDLAMVVNPAFMRYVHEAWLEKKGYYPSTGFLTLVLALHICDEVRVFGFGANKDGDWNHYWAPNGFKNIKTGAHPGSFEYETIQKLAEHQIVQFFPGW